MGVRIVVAAVLYFASMAAVMSFITYWPVLVLLAALAYWAYRGRHNRLAIGLAILPLWGTVMLGMMIAMPYGEQYPGAYPALISIGLPTFLAGALGMFMFWFGMMMTTAAFVALIISCLAMVFED